MARLHERGWIQVTLVLLACAAVFWPLLGQGGLAMTEGHRVIPAWEMLASGDWLTTRMFGTAYVRKPPGIAWLIALSSMLFGQTEWAARAALASCATLMALVALAFGRRWFGARWGIGAGLAQALSPLMWEVGRSAEIEALHALGVQLCALACIDLTRSSRARQGAWMAGLVAIGVFVAALSKGPAGAPVVVGALVGGVFARRSIRALRSPWLWVGLGAGAIASGGMFLLLARALGDEPAVRAAPASHLWSAPVTQILALGPTGFVYALPLSLALLRPWGPDARREGDADEREAGVLECARALAWAWVVAMALWTAIGLSNPRYVMPGVVVLAPLAAYALRGAFRAGAFTERRRMIARWMFLGRPAVWVILLLGGAWVYIGSREAGVRASSGREAGGRMGRALVRTLEDLPELDRRVLIADDAIEARPEALQEIRRTLREAGLGEAVEIRWTPWGAEDGPPPGWDLALIRADGESTELGNFAELIEQGRVGLIDEQRISKYVYRLYLHRDEAPMP
ncbi:MAG: ArnT family glycosyltransferase [Phycisphaerales bacterium JB059]